MIITWILWVCLVVVAFRYVSERLRVYEDRRRLQSVPERLIMLSAQVEVLRDEVFIPALMVLEDIMAEICDLGKSK